MVQSVLPDNALEQLRSQRLVRYADLRPCTTAFIDTRTPGRQEKENFTIIGPGVAENPDQHVHIEIPHGFNIGGARQPPGCINSQHSHETAEVFVIHKGTWAFYLGAKCEDGEIVLKPGDTISIPTGVFRGFKNVGSEPGYMFAVLGGDDPGHVTWAPDVFVSAEKFGLILCDNGSLVDTTKGETIPDGRAAMKPTTADDVAALRKMTADELASCVVTHDVLRRQPRFVPSAIGLRETPIIGTASTAEGLSNGRMDWPHGFHLRHVRIDIGVCSKLHSRAEEEVIMLQSGELTLRFDAGDVVMTPGDVFTTPIGLAKTILNSGSEPAEAYIVRGSDHPEAARIIG